MDTILDRFQKLRNQEGFTLVEILIVVALIAILTVLALMILNPTVLRYKLYDNQRKRDLNNLKGLYDVFYSDNLRYPTGDEICYDTPEEDNGTCTCNICGLESDNSPFGNILQRLYCDPQHPSFTYVYQYQCSEEPQWYRAYTYLSTEGEDTNQCVYGVSNRPDSFLEPYPDSCGTGTGSGGGGDGGDGGGDDGGGGGGGGGSPTNTPTPTPTPASCPADPAPKYCRLGGICNICGTFADCQQPSACDQPLVLYSDSSCTNTCVAP